MQMIRSYQRERLPFVDREVETRKLESAVRVDSRSSPSVLWIHGISGIGKSGLLKQFATSTFEESKRLTLYSMLDLDQLPAMDPARVMLSLRKNTHRYRAPSFPHFDVTYALYFIRKNPDIPLNKETFALLEELNIGASLLAVATDALSAVGPVPNLLNWLLNKAKHLQLDHTLKRHIENFNQLAEDQRLDLLTDALILDLKKMVDHALEVRPTIFLDTVEKAVLGGYSPLDQERFKRWFLYFINALTEYQIICASQLEPDAGEIGADITRTIDVMEIGPLAPEHVQQMLQPLAGC